MICKDSTFNAWHWINIIIPIFVGNKNFSAHSYTPPFNFIMIKITSRIAIPPYIGNNVGEHIALN